MKRVLAVAVMAVLGSAALGIVVPYLEARAGDERELPLTRDFVRLIPPYPDARYRAAGDDLHVDGAWRVMAYAETDDAPARVLVRYTQMFEDRGLVVDRYDDGLVAVSHDDLWRRTIVVTPRGRGTLIVASISQTRPNLARARMPIPPGCAIHESAGSRDSSVVRENVQIACGGFAHEVIGYYDGLMGEPAQILESDDGATQVTAYDHGDEHMTLVTTQTHDGETPVVSATLHWEAR